MGKGTGCGGGQGAFVCCSFSGSDGHLVPCCFQIFFYFMVSLAPGRGEEAAEQAKARYAWVPFLFCPPLPGFPRADDGINGASSTLWVKAGC
jgi:hypothetical protein